MKLLHQVICRFLLIFLSLVGLTIFCFGNNAFAETLTVKGSIWVNGDNVNVREQPTTKSKSLGKVNTGTELGLYENRSDGWSCIDYNDTVAYIRSDFLSETQVIAAVSVPKSTKANSENVKSSPESATSDSTNDTVVGVTVYISKTGKCYHSKSTCSNMKNPSAVSIEKAISMGREPCSKCY